MHRSKKAVVGLCLLRFCPHESAALQTLGGPDCVKIVEFRNRLIARWQRHPRLFGGCVNVDVWRTEIRVVHGTDADEPNDRTGLRVVAPNRDPAGWAAGDLLALAARRGCHDDFGVPPSLSFVSIMNCRQRCCSIGTTDASSTPQLSSFRQTLLFIGEPRFYFCIEPNISRSARTPGNFATGMKLLSNAAIDLNESMFSKQRVNCHDAIFSFNAR